MRAAEAVTGTCEVGDMGNATGNIHHSARNLHTPRRDCIVLNALLWVNALTLQLPPNVCIAVLCTRDNPKHAVDVRTWKTASTCPQNPPQARLGVGTCDESTGVEVCRYFGNHLVFQLAVVTQHRYRLLVPEPVTQSDLPTLSLAPG